MSIIGIGCDIVNIQRIQKCFGKFGDRFLNKVFSELEIVNAPKKSSLLYYPYFAKRFAGKEACAKALRIGIGALSFKDIEIINDTQNAPILNILKSGYKKYKFHISLSDDSGFALAYVVIVKQC